MRSLTRVDVLGRGVAGAQHWRPWLVRGRLTPRYRTQTCQHKRPDSAGFVVAADVGFDIRPLVRVSTLAIRIRIGVAP